MKRQKKLVGGRRLNRSYGGDAFIITLLTIFGVFFAFPLVFNINHAFKPLNEIFLFPPNVWVRNPTANNFQDLFIIMSKSWVTGIVDSGVVFIDFPSGDILAFGVRYAKTAESGIHVYRQFYNAAAVVNQYRGLPVSL